MTNLEFVAKLQDVVDNYKTVYMWGTFGMPVTDSLIKAKVAQYPSYYPTATQNMLKSIVGKNYFAFDCVGLIKGTLWGFSGDSSKTNGGCTYASNGVPDINANQMLINCSDISTDFSKIEVGEAVWLTGHIGVYVGDGMVIESTTAWNNCVQTTACRNIGTITGLNSRTWAKHGKLPYITYEKAATNNTGNGSSDFPTTSDVSVGSNVRFSGGRIYETSIAKTASVTKGESNCKVTAMASANAHPYHIVSEDGRGVYGWVDAANVVLPSGEIQVGSMVYITAEQYASGETVPNWVKHTPHTVSKIKDEIALIGSPDRINSTVELNGLVLA